MHCGTQMFAAGSLCLRQFYETTTAEGKILQAIFAISLFSFHCKIIFQMIHSKLLHIGGLFYELPMKAQQLYSSWQCRLELYNCLLAVVMTPHSLCPPPTQITLNILQTAIQRDASVRVRQQCSMNLMQLEKLVHPQKEGLLFPIEARDIRNAFIRLGQERLLDETIDILGNKQLSAVGNDVEENDADDDEEEE